ncbi:hypothetical protein JOD55_001393 [Arcanobacterium pluranimalium]|uniref:hypothetical protein n=1 Tax=Arcanobacterium pluranimalium TaxID=108028 RepID=UPI00195CD8AD|nr:hypothetical protein [Arcanobacterium pluranimalium]MBM7825566.1 hypothetical protein [Arcanobacterium pluranimalium]
MKFMTEADNAENNANSRAENSGVTAESPSSVGKLSAQDMQKLKKAQRRNFIFALVLGLILLVCGYFAGQKFRESSSHSSSPAISVTFENDQNEVGNGAGI